MTEDEAKQKWCPYTQKAQGDPAEFGVANCIGSACMMFRKNVEEDPMGDDVATKIYESCYCGLAGKP